MEAAMNIRDLHKSFGRRTVLNGIDLTLAPGTVTGLIGRNGEGKTTLMNLLLGNLAFKRGTISVLGLNPAKRRDSERIKERIGFVSENPRFYPWMTVRELARYVAAFYRSWSVERQEAFCRRFDVDTERKIKVLSRGQLAMVGLMLVFSREPELLLLDDPTLGLDTTARREVLEVIVDLVADGGRTVLITSHFLPELERLADRVAVLHHGKIVLDRELAGLKETARRVFVELPAGQGLPEAPGFDAVRQEDGGWELVSFQFSDGLLAPLRQALPRSLRVEPANLETIFEAATGFKQRWFEEGDGR